MLLVLGEQGRPAILAEQAGDTISRRRNHPILLWMSFCDCHILGARDHRMRWRTSRYTYWHSRQWQGTDTLGVPSTWQRTAPHKHPPLDVLTMLSSRKLADHQRRLFRNSSL
jgi:hypothetical protein